MLLTDANAHLGSVATAAVGDLAAKEENLSGASFHSFLQLDCLLPATFSTFHSGPSVTWVGPGEDPAQHRGLLKSSSRKELTCKLLRLTSSCSVEKSASISGRRVQS